MKVPTTPICGPRRFMLAKIVQIASAESKVHKVHQVFLLSTPSQQVFAFGSIFQQNIVRLNVAMQIAGLMHPLECLYLSEDVISIRLTSYIAMFDTIQIGSERRPSFSRMSKRQSPRRSMRSTDSSSVTLKDSQIFGIPAIRLIFVSFYTLNRNF